MSISFVIEPGTVFFFKDSQCKEAVQGSVEGVLSKRLELPKYKITANNRSFTVQQMSLSTFYTNTDRTGFVVQHAIFSLPYITQLDFMSL